MKGITGIFRRINTFFKKDIWELDMQELSKAKARWIKYAKVLLITIKTFSAEKIGFQAVALSFFGTMSVVPFIAVAFAVTGGLGLDTRLKELLYANFSGHPEVIDMVLGFADNIIHTAESSAMGLVSALLFVWLIFWMMISVERVFNNVWRVRIQEDIVLHGHPPYFPFHNNAVFLRLHHIFQYFGRHRTRRSVLRILRFVFRMGSVLYSGGPHFLRNVQIHSQSQGTVFQRFACSCPVGVGVHHTSISVS